MKTPITLDIKTEISAGLSPLAMTVLIAGFGIIYIFNFTMMN